MNPATHRTILNSSSSAIRNEKRKKNKYWKKRDRSVQRERERDATVRRNGDSDGVVNDSGVDLVNVRVDLSETQFRRRISDSPSSVLLCVSFLFPCCYVVVPM